MEIVANIGDRADGRLFGRRLMPTEGQYVVGDFGSWRGWFWDFDREEVFPLYLRTPGRSTAAGNMSWEILKSPSSRPAVFTSAFFFSEGAAPGEAGQGIWYREPSTIAQSPVPRDRDDGVSANPAVLYWHGAPGATRHDVDIGTNEKSVESAGRDDVEFHGSVERPTTEIESLTPGTTYYWRIDPMIDGDCYRGSVWELTTAEASERQVPGDCNVDGVFDISDPVCLFGNLFVGNPRRLPCGDGSAVDGANVDLLDWQGDRSVDISDGIAALGFLFGGGFSHSGLPVGARCLSVGGCPPTCPE